MIGSGQGILVVDGDYSTVVNTAIWLGKQNFKAFCCTAAKTALEILSCSSHPIELLLVNHNLPDMTGEELAKQAARMKPNIKVICFDAENISQTVTKLLE